VGCPDFCWMVLLIVLQSVSTLLFLLSMAFVHASECFYFIDSTYHGICSCLMFGLWWFVATVLQSSPCRTRIFGLRRVWYPCFLHVTVSVWASWNFSFACTIVLVVDIWVGCGRRYCSLAAVLLTDFGGVFGFIVDGLRVRSVADFLASL
jgi:hypothetical protein